VLIWRDESKRSATYLDVLAHLDAAGLTVHEVHPLLVGLDEDPTRYVIPQDMHPTPLAHDRIARYVVQTILGREPAP
jgi:hypothetical protein